jgi:hypothetical protein
VPGKGWNTLLLSRSLLVLAAGLACALAFITTQAGAQTEPLGGQPALL